MKVVIPEWQVLAQQKRALHLHLLAVPLLRRQPEAGTAQNNSSAGSTLSLFSTLINYFKSTSMELISQPFCYSQHLSGMR